MPFLIKPFGTGYYYLINVKQYVSTLIRSWYSKLKNSPFPSWKIPDHLGVFYFRSNGQRWKNKFLCSSAMCLLHDPMAVPWETLVVTLFDAFPGHSSSFHIMSLFQLQDSFWLHVQHVNQMLSSHVGLGSLCPNSLKSIFFMNASCLFPVSKTVIANFPWNTFF